MSFDRQVDQLCPHLVVDEFLLVQTDGQTIIPIRPISSAASVVVRLNGELTIPSAGIHIPAESSGIKEGPFTITAGVNNLLKVRVNGGPLQTAVLPTSSREPVSQIADRLTAILPGVRFSAERNFLKFRSELSGRDATVFIDPSSTFTSTVGFKANRVFRGQEVAPGWTLVNDHNTERDRPVRLIIFDSPLRGFNDYAEVNYTTVRQECRRCGGVGVENDWRYGSNGSVAEIRQEGLLIQELQKVIYTVRGSNPFHPWYGASIVEQIGQKLSTRGIVQNAITSDIYATFGRWQSIKRQQEEAVGQFIEDGEFPFRLISVSLDQSQKDPTVVFVNIEVQSRSNQALSLSRGIRLPQPEDLLGSTQLESVVRQQTLRDFTMVG
jgi:hypothetical protein